MELTHFNENGRARMVEVGNKNDTKRVAIAKCTVIMKKETIKKIKDGSMKKGDVLSVAQVGGIMGAKRTSDLIPMCHNIFISGADINFEVFEDRIEIEAQVNTVGKTGIEMEALTAVTTAALTIYDMCKAIDRGIIITDIKLVKKAGGKSGLYIRKENLKYKGKVLSVNLSKRREDPKVSIGKGHFIEEHGLEGDVHAGKWHRQVSLFAVESLNKIKEPKEKEKCEEIYSENITTEGINLWELPIGTKLKIGDVIFQITQIGKDYHGDLSELKSREVVMHKEGIFCVVLNGGIIKQGDDIEIIE